MFRNIFYVEMNVFERNAWDKEEKGNEKASKKHSLKWNLHNEFNEYGANG